MIRHVPREKKEKGRRGREFGRTCAEIFSEAAPSPFHFPSARQEHLVKK